MSCFEQEIALIEASGLFDPDWYLGEYRDVATLGMDPIEHYLWIGARLGRDPGPGFDTAHYLAANADVLEAGVNPLLHYLAHGQGEGRSAKPHVVARADTAERVDVVIPVHNALEDVRRCLESVRRQHDGLELRVIVVNDASDDDTAAWLRAFCRREAGCELIEHAENRGYTRAVNTGLRASRAPYIVILNSDTVVTSGWLRGLLRGMTSRPRLGIVGPLSNAASWQNVPVLVGADGSFAINALPAGMTPDDMARLVATASRRKYPAMPFVNGFCYMVRREVVDAIGEMDEESFPEGYGEENDYCIRAQDAGFELAVVDDVYVFHAKSRSFGHDRRKALSEKGAAALRRKHGARYAALVKAVKDTSRLDDVRAAVAGRLAEWRAAPEPAGDPMAMRILFLLPVRGGGGGAHSVVQEASEMRRLGVDARIAVGADSLASFLEIYADVGERRELFVGYEETTLAALASRYDVVVATVYSSVRLLKEIAEIHPHILPAYYVQDYEPLFFSPETVTWREAHESYRLVPGAVLFAKTHWIANKVRSEHGLHVHNVEPSIDHAVYAPRPRGGGAPLRVTAMIRPQTPYRGAERTMRVLSRQAAALGDRISIDLFGCAADDPRFRALAPDFAFRNHGVLKRPEVAALLAQSDLFVDLSDYQAFGRTGLEAMASGCVATVPVHGGTDEYAIDGVNALVLDSFDEDACCEAIASLLRSPERLSAMRAEGLRTASRYSIHAAVVSELTLFASRLAEHRARHPQRARPRLALVPALADGDGAARPPTGSAYVRLLCPYSQPSVLRHWEVEIEASGAVPAPETGGVVALQRDLGLADLSELDAWLAALRRAGGRMVYEVDDDLLDGAAVRDRGYKGDVEALTRRVRHLAMSADMVTVSTPALAERFRPLNPAIRIVPNFVDPRLWRPDSPRDHGDGPHARDGDVVRIGYIGTPTHDRDLAVVAEAMHRIEQDYGRRVGVEVIGAFQNSPPAFGQRVGLPRNSRYPVFVDWLHQRVHWDIAIIPLADDAFNRSKSHLKFIECACLDLAIVCSDVESYAGVAQDGRNCLAVPNDTESWRRALVTLIEDRAMRERLATRARRDVIDGYTTEGNAELYLDTLERATEMDGGRAAILAAE